MIFIMFFNDYDHSGIRALAKTLYYDLGLRVCFVSSYECPVHIGLGECRRGGIFSGRFYKSREVRPV